MAHQKNQGILVQSGFVSDLDRSKGTHPWSASLDVTVATLEEWSKEMAAMLEEKKILLGTEFYFYAKFSFCFN